MDNSKKQNEEKDLLLFKIIINSISLIYISIFYKLFNNILFKESNSVLQLELREKCDT